MKKGLPHGDTMLHKDTHAKHLFPGSEAEAKRIDDYRRKIIGTDGVMRNPNGESYRKVRAAGFKLAKKNSFDSTHNIVTASPVHNAVASHELGHASRLNKDPFESYLDAVDMEHGEPLRQSMGNKEHSDVVKHIKNAYRDGNKNSKEVGRRLLGAYNEARKKGNDELMNEIHANAWSYNKLHELHGKDIADKSLDSNLYSNLTYALSAAQKGNKKAKDLVSHMTQSPIKTKKKMVDPRAIYNLRRDSGVVSKRK
jgi:hypothetical protein